MSLNNKDFGALIVNYLHKIIDGKEVSEDNAESLNVAIDCISDVFELDPTSEEKIINDVFNKSDLKTITLKGLGLQNVSDVVELEVKNEEISEDKKKEAEALKLEGNKQMSLKNYKSAIDKYSKAIEIYPSNPFYYSNRAAAYQMIEDFTNAVLDANTAIKLDPTYSKAYSRLGAAKLAEGNNEDAVHAFKKVLELEGDKSTEVMKNDYENAKKLVQTFVTLNKNVPDPSGPPPLNTTDVLTDIATVLGSSFGSLMNNTQMMQRAQQMMQTQNPEMMQQVEGLMQNPVVRQFAENVANGNGPGGLSDVLNNPSVKEVANGLMNGYNVASSVTVEEPESKNPEKQ
ncbi:hypothetical protein Kpol_1032p8 [Vanderwaltozyma polyspora DSM 70294]|uniref:SGTA homodimerisation domain-containing protein n=1 Tax=Vanderwaltozyma polyspora (strain ATCC 22028 / DSM 70294 / BCRC 21397 / CBS 2163 / NBRC 10782 / NRRL Y-8283 / UCD 57-17) TaxID=436907 RepID=A7TGW4_VANPO|nr:uncharacterized protein Kpol_1032p8 [Vanderwaltozyma polyspora DSM 70294]EDO18416.1 hypothetical protein Kpol_1032p8 [Vanderwaltozyma polyspora DSM 70294]